MAADIVIAHHRRAQYPQRGGRPLSAGANLRTGGLAAEQRLHCLGEIRADRKTVCCRQTVRRLLLPLHACQRSRFATLPGRRQLRRPMPRDRHGQTVNGKLSKKAACTLFWMRLRPLEKAAHILKNSSYNSVFLQSPMTITISNPVDGLMYKISYVSFFPWKKLNTGNCSSKKAGSPLLSYW